jgi:hypothetical protein
MERHKAVELLRDDLIKHGLTGWSIRWNQNPESRFLGLCSYKDKCIILSAHHVDIHPDPDVINTIHHEVAHAVVGPFHGHDAVWAAKAREVGCDNTLPCSNLSLSPDIIDAIRSGATVEVTFDEQVIRTPRYTVTRLQDKCEVCGKVAVSKSEQIIKTPGDSTPNIKIISLECGHSVIRQIPKGTPFHTFQMGGDPTCKHEWNKNSCAKCNRKRPYDFQIEGMNFLEAGLSVNHGAACFDEMGLGKTIQAGGVLYFHPEWWPTLWIVKSGLKYQTFSFIHNWMNKGNGGFSHIPQIINTSKDYLMPGFSHFIIGYDMLVPKTKKLKSGKTITIGFDINKFNHIGGECKDGVWTGGHAIKCVVLDECQQIKNVDSARTQMVRRVVKGRKVIPLSGTPWNNRGSELYPVLNMMDHMKFPSQERFKREWVATYWDGKFEKEGGIKRIPQFKEYTKDLCIRRERTEVLPELPLVNRTKLNVVMTPEQEKTYDAAVEKFVEWYNEQVGEISGMSIIAEMAKMRHLVGLAKIDTTKEYVDEFIEDTDRKLVIFAYHRDVQFYLYRDLKEKYEGEEFKKENGYNIPVLKVVEEMNARQRQETCDTFNATKRVILVASQTVLGEGQNLQTCSDCVMHERQWNPGREEQCEGRFIRIGSLATSVNAVYAQLEGLTTTDPRLDQIVERKRVQFNKLHSNGETAPAWSSDSIMKELAQVIVNAHNAKKGRK